MARSKTDQATPHSACRLSRRARPSERDDGQLDLHEQRVCDPVGFAVPVNMTSGHDGLEERVETPNSQVEFGDVTARDDTSG